MKTDDTMALILIVDDEHSVRQVLARWIQGDVRLWKPNQRKLRYK
jgi:CheY-like chemotaxis protein